MKFVFSIITALSLTTVYCEEDISKRLGAATRVVDQGHSEHGGPSQYEAVGDSVHDLDLIHNLQARTDVAKPPLVDKPCDQSKGCSLKLCEGDCHTNSHCDYGLKCFNRNGFAPVPGCSGKGTSGIDYCISKRELIDVGIDPKVKLNLCEGDCDYDSNCGSGLKCFQRGYYEYVPGCTGPTKDNWDYCIEERTLVFIGEYRNSLKLCEGDCDTDSNCAGKLKCFQRSNGEPVPGCIGFGIREYDYCI